MSDTRTDVLVVDDNPEVCFLAQRELERQGLKVETISSPVEAARAVGALQPRVIILDIIMPGMTGYELARAIKQVPFARDIPVIFLSSLPEAETEEPGFDVGAHEVHQKDRVTWKFLAERVKFLAQLAEENS